MGEKIIKYIYYGFIIIIVINFLSSAGFLSDLQLNPFDYARITELDYRAEVVDEPDDPCRTSSLPLTSLRLCRICLEAAAVSMC